MDDPECFYGKNVEGDVSPIGSLGDNFAGEVIVRGLIFDVEEKEIRNGEKVVITACLTDFTDSIKFKIFVNQALIEQSKSSGYELEPWWEEGHNSGSCF